METSKQVLIVCTGNICRSPMAVGLLKSLLHLEGLADRVTVRSAGTRALVDHHASQHAIDAMNDLGIDITQHRARQLSRSGIASADQILVMEERHRGTVLDLADHTALFKTLLIAELVGKHSPIQDPYGMPPSAYRDCAAELKDILSDGLPSLLQRLTIS